MGYELTRAASHGFMLIHVSMRRQDERLKLEGACLGGRTPERKVRALTPKSAAARRGRLAGRFVAVGIKFERERFASCMASLDLEREKTGGRCLMTSSELRRVASVAFHSLNFARSHRRSRVACITAAGPGLQVATVSTTCCPPRLDAQTPVTSTNASPRPSSAAQPGLLRVAHVMLRARDVLLRPHAGASWRHPGCTRSAGGRQGAGGGQARGAQGRVAALHRRARRASQSIGAG